MKVRLTRRLGQHQPSTVLERSATEAEWLVSHGHAVYVEAWELDDSERDTDEDDLGALTLAELKAKAEEVGVPTYGTKAQIAERLTEHGGAAADQ